MPCVSAFALARSAEKGQPFSALRAMSRLFGLRPSILLEPNKMSFLLSTGGMLRLSRNIPPIACVPGKCLNAFSRHAG